MGEVLRLTRWEWFKLRRRWMPWILLAPLVLIPQIWLWSEFFAYGNVTNSYERPTLYFRDGGDSTISFSCADLDDGTVDARLATFPEEYRLRGLESIAQIRELEICEEQSADYVRALKWHSQIFVAPVSLANGLVTTHLTAFFFMAFLASSLQVGSEYGLGTLRHVLARGVGRWQVLASKAILLVLVSVAAFLVVSIPVTVSSLIATALAPEGRELADAGGWSTVVVMFCKVVYGLVPYIALAFFLTVLTRSTSLAISLAIGYIFSEAIIISFLGYRFEDYGWFQNFLDFNLGPAVAGWLVEEGVRAAGEDSAMFPLDKAQNNLRAFLVILAYTAALSGASLRLFLRRDVSGAKGS